jgi:diguanylate cyclase (GGDEF)-like protein/PAS domain S-box-containing protein
MLRHMGGESAALGAVRVLVIEDDRACAMIVERHLAAIPSVHCEVHIVRSLGDALTQLAQRHYDLVIADLHLPDSSASDTVATLVHLCHQPVIALTIDERPELRARALADGAYDYLVKGQLADGSLDRPVRLAALQARTLASLRRSEERFRSLTALSSDWYWEQDAEFRLTFMSTIAGDKSDLDISSYLGQRRWDRPALNLSEADWARHRAVLERHEPFRDFEMERPVPAGGTRWHSVSGEPVFDAEGRFTGYRGIGRDITEQKRGEQRLRLEHAVTRVLAEAESVPMALQGVLRAICETEGWDCGRYFHLDTASSVMRMQQAWSGGKAQAERFIELSRSLAITPGLGLVGAVWASGEPLWVADAQNDPRALISPKGWSRGSFLCPVCSDGRTIGIIALASGTAREPDARLLQAVSVIGRQLGQFLRRKEAERVMRDSEERFRRLIELSSDFYWETDAAHRITRTTHAEKHRPASEPVLGKARWQVPCIHPDAAGWAAHRATLEAREPFRDFEIGRIDPDGDQRFLSISGEPMYGADGEFLGYRGVGRDITERRRDERLVRLEHAVTRHLADERDAGAALRAVMGEICRTEKWDCGRYFRVEEAANLIRCEECWSTGAGPLARFAEASRAVALARGEGLVGHVWQSGEPLWCSDVSRDPRTAPYARVREAGVHGALMFPVTFENRVVGVLSISSAAVRRPEERLLRTMRVVGAQIGQFLSRKQAESALEESEARFRQTFELAASGIAQVDLGGRFIDVNRRLCEMLGYSEGELLGRSVKDISHAEDRDTTDNKRGLMHEGKLASVQFEKRYVHKDGRAVWVNLTVALVRNAQGDPQHEIAVMEDITERKEREGALQRFRTALDASADMVLLFDLANGRLLDFNQTACTLLGYSREELLALRAWQIRTDATVDSLRAETARLMAIAGRTSTVLTQYRRKDGSTFPVESHRSLLDTPQGRVLVVNSRDLSERMSAEKRRAAQARYQKKIARLGQAALSKRNPAELVAKAVQSVLEGLALGPVAYLERSGSDGEVVLRRIAGLASGPGDCAAAQIAPGSALAPLLSGSDTVVVNGPWESAAPLPFEWLRRYGALAAAPVPADGGPRGFLCAFAEASGAFGPEEQRFLAAAASMVSAALHRLDSEARLAYLAQFDPLTGLPNRTLLADRFSLMIVQARRRGVSLGVLFIDLDDFKLVNDTQGHAAGDELLKEAARRLQSAVRDGDTVARISGDEFAVILSDLARPDDAALVAQKIIDRLSSPVLINAQDVVVTASIGIATFPADGADAEALLSAADAAMYRAKQSGRNAFQFFTADINHRTRARAQLGIELRRALERKEFTLAYQPKIDLMSGQPCGAEALLRWDHPERGRVAPVEFIPVLEETGLIVPVGEWVLRRACEDLKHWQQLGAPAMPVAVNLSARQFRQHDLESRIRAIVASAGIKPSLIELEITESQLMHDPDHAVRMLRALGEAGLRIAIDDFGTGYSSLSYLTRFPLASLKIDRSFVADVLDDEADATIVRTIVDMAHTLGFTVIAEGVERDSQAAFLRALGCEQAQGFLFARPMSADEFSSLIVGVSAPAGLRRRHALRKSVKS